MNNNKELLHQVHVLVEELQPDVAIFVTNAPVTAIVQTQDNYFAGYSLMRGNKENILGAFITLARQIAEALTYEEKVTLMAQLVHQFTSDKKQDYMELNINDGFNEQ